jgi:mannose-1-phosphate guanylyltransferase
MPAPITNASTAEEEQTAPLSSVAPPARAFLLAAGLGTRLRPLTLVLPKPLLPVGGRPMLDHALALLAQHGIGPRACLVNAHHLHGAIEAWGRARGVAVQVELPEVLGTGGGLKVAEPRLAERFVVLNGDILCDVDLRALLAAVPPGGAALALRNDPALSSEAPVERDAHDVVVRMREFARGPGAPLPGTHFTGVHAADRAVLAYAKPEFSCILRTAYKAVIGERKLAALLHRGAWVDIGAPAEYLDANLAVLDGLLAAPGGLAPGARGPGGALLVDGARVEGAVHRSVVGAGAVVPAGARLTDCVVWDGVIVPPGDHHRCVFFGRPGAQAERLEVPLPAEGARAEGPG